MKLVRPLSRYTQEPSPVGHIAHNTIDLDKHPCTATRTSSDCYAIIWANQFAVVPRYKCVG